MNIQHAIEKLIAGENLSDQAMDAVMTDIMSGSTTNSQIGGFLTALRCKGETVTEITAAAKVMRKLATPVHIATQQHLLDTCGTGGDGANTFNISTVSAIIAAAAGAKIAKHGNRSVSSRSGSADVLAAAGVRLDISPIAVANCIEQCNVGFMFAPAHHSAMQHAITARRELGIRTIFNLLGPLTNPAGAKRQVLGVFAQQWLRPMAAVLQALGSEQVMVVHGADGLDEITISGKTHVAELKDGNIHEYTITPEQFGLTVQSLESITVTNAAESLALIQQVLADKPGTARDISLLNAAAAIYVSGIANNLTEGFEYATTALQNGTAQQTLAKLIDCSQHG